MDSSRLLLVALVATSMAPLVSAAPVAELDGLALPADRDLRARTLFTLREGVDPAALAAHAGVRSGVHLEKMRLGLAAIQDLDAENAYRSLEAHAAELTDGSNCPPPGICGAVVGALEAARKVSTYPGGLRILATTYRAILEEPDTFLGAPEDVFPRTLELALEVAAGQSNLDAWLTLLHMMDGLANCEACLPSPFMKVALLAARDGSVHAPGYAEAYRLLERAATYLKDPRCSPKECSFRAALVTAEVAVTAKARFWVLLQFGDQLVRSDLLSDLDRELLQPAVDKAWAGDFPEGIAALEAAFRELLGDRS